MLKSFHVIVGNMAAVGDPIDEFAKIILDHPSDSSRLYLRWPPVVLLPDEECHTRGGRNR
jgi:hypothetical protein